MHGQISLVIGVDSKTLPQFEVSHRTWKLHQPKMWNWPWVVFYDWTVETFPLILSTLQDRGAFPEQAVFVPWPYWEGKHPKYDSQREKMLSGFPYVAAQFVQTPWWCKLDTDAICHRASDWPDPAWFEREQAWGDSDSDGYRSFAGMPPVIVAPGWHYTKGINFLGRLEEWGDRAMPEYRRLNIPFDQTHLRVPHPRWCSWNSFYDTDWTKAFVGTVRQSGLADGTLPVPSQDTAMWYVAERAKHPVRKINMKKVGWNNHPKLDKLIEAAQSVMRGETQEAMLDA